MKIPDGLIEWLLEGDVSIQYQVSRDLLSENKKKLQDDIPVKGWGAKLLSKRNDSGHWGKGYYQPKWISSHYTLLDLRNLCLPQDNSLVQSTIHTVLVNGKGADGGVTHARTNTPSDICVNGMFLNFSSYFGAEEKQLESVVDFLVDQEMVDGGFNCRSNRSGAVHSSVHSTISVMEGIQEYINNGYTYRHEELQKALAHSIEFLLLHQLYLSDRTGQVINDAFLRLPYPGRWRYDILRALDFFQYAGLPWDERLQPAISILLSKRNKDGTWNVNAKYPGKIHFEMEKAGQPSRWNTLRVLRVFKHFGIADF